MGHGNTVKRVWAFLLVTISGGFVYGGESYRGSNILGYGGAIVIPSAYVGRDGEITIGVNRIPKLYAAKLQPYETSMVYSASVNVLPFVEVYLALIRPDRFKGGTGDRTGGIRVRVMKETKYFPAIAMGSQDFFASRQLGIEPAGSQVFASLYGVASKSFVLPRSRTLFVHLGYGTDRLPANTYQLVGIFAALEVEALPNLYVLLEHDAENVNFGVRGRLFSLLQLSAGLWRCRELSLGVDFTFNLRSL